MTKEGDCKSVLLQLDGIVQKLMIPVTNFHLPAKTLRQLFGKCSPQVWGCLVRRQNTYERWKSAGTSPFCSTVMTCPLLWSSLLRAGGGCFSPFAYWRYYIPTSFSKTYHSFVNSLPQSVLTPQTKWHFDFTFYTLSKAWRVNTRYQVEKNWISNTMKYYSILKKGGNSYINHNMGETWDSHYALSVNLAS